MAKYWLFWFFFRALGRLPLSALYLLAILVADASYLAFPAVRANVWDNLSHVMPEKTPKHRLRRAARQVFRTVTLYYADLASLPRLDTRQFFDERLRVFGLKEHLLPAVESGRGVVMMSAHFGNPELVVQGLLAVGVNVLALTEPQKPRRLSSLMDGIRASKGHEFAPVSVGSVKRVVRTLKRGGTVALMGDRDIQGPRQRLPFFGEETWMPTGPIEVALRTGAIVIPCFAVRKGRIFEAFMEEPLELERTSDFQQDVRAGALAFLARFEMRLREEPGQWAVLERVWEDEGRQV